MNTKLNTKKEENNYEWETQIIVVFKQFKYKMTVNIVQKIFIKITEKQSWQDSTGVRTLRVQTRKKMEYCQLC